MTLKKKKIIRRHEGEPIDTPKAEGEAEPEATEGDEEAEDADTGPVPKDPEEAPTLTEGITHDASGRRNFPKHEEVRHKKQVEAALDNSAEMILDGIEARARLYGVDEKGQTKLQPHNQYVVRCQCGYLHTFCDEWPVHQDNRLRKFDCPKCRFTIPYKHGATREYHPDFCKHIDQEIAAEVKKIKAERAAKEAGEQTA